jgi:hypothetical protein
MKCEECRWWQAVMSNKSGVEVVIGGECRRYAPRGPIAGDYDAFTWTRPDAWCGDFAEKEASR